jgi:hypothetical protein
MKDLKQSKALLRTILLSINGAESEESPALEDKLRQALKVFRCDLALAFTENEQVAAYDSVFKAAGWDNQGFRWCRDYKELHEGRVTSVLLLVEFINQAKTSWNPI